MGHLARCDDALHHSLLVLSSTVLGRVGWKRPSPRVPQTEPGCHAGFGPYAGARRPHYRRRMSGRLIDTFTTTVQVSNGDVHLHVATVDHVDGPVVVLLHGLGGWHGEWARTAAALAPHVRVVAFDQITRMAGRADVGLVEVDAGHDLHLELPEAWHDVLLAALSVHA